MSQQVWAAQALESFDAVVNATEGFRSRPGQRLMAEQVARTFSRATLGKVDEESGEDAPTRSIAVIQAGTGVGKSLAYCAPASALALARGTRVLISTATGVMVTRAASEDTVGTSILGQLSSQWRALALSAVFLAIVSLVPGMPKLFMWAICGLLGWMAWLQYNGTGINATAAGESAEGAEGEAEGGAEGGEEA